MSVKVFANLPGLVNITPSPVFIYTDNTYSQVITSGFLNNADTFYGKVFTNTQIAYVLTSDLGIQTLAVSVDVTSGAARTVSLVPLSVPYSGKGTYGGGSTSTTVTITGLTSSYNVVATLNASTNAAYITKAVCSANTLTVTFNTDPGASTVFSYMTFL